MIPKTAAHPPANKTALPFLLVNAREQAHKPHKTAKTVKMKANKLPKNSPSSNAEI